MDIFKEKANANKIIALAYCGKDDFFRCVAVSRLYYSVYQHFMGFLNSKRVPYNMPGAHSHADFWRTLRYTLERFYGGYANYNEILFVTNRFASVHKDVRVKAEYYNAVVTPREWDSMYSDAIFLVNACEW